MDFAPILEGFAVVLQPENLLYCLIGVVIGMLIGVLPGLGPAATVAILLPLTFNVEPVTAIIMLAGIFYGAQYGGTITSVLLRLPGEASSVVTVFDGYAMARQGRAGAALGIAAIGSFIGGTISIIALTFVAPLVAGFALDFGPPEYAVLAMLGILLVATVGSGGLLKAVIAAAIGLLLATVGRDGFTGAERFTFDSLVLSDGIDFVPIAMGIFGIGEILYNLEDRHNATKAPVKVTRVLPTKEDMKASAGPIGRGSVIGFFLGILPGGGAVLSSMAAYALEKRRSKHPERFGQGAIEGVAAPETANNAAATSSFIPLLTLGIPANATIAVIFGALLIQGVTPGPQLVERAPRAVLGRGQLHVHRQHPAADHEHPADRGVRPDPAGASLDPGPDHRLDHAGRCVHRGQQRHRHPAGLRVRRVRLSDEEVRLRTRAAGPRVRARLHPGELAAPLVDLVRGRPDRVRHPTHLRHARRAAARRPDPAVDQSDSPAGVPVRPKKVQEKENA